MNILCRCIHKKSSIKTEVTGSILAVRTINSLHRANHLRVWTLEFITSCNSLQQGLAQVVFEHNDYAPPSLKKIQFKLYMPLPINGYQMAKSHRPQYLSNGYSRRTQCHTCRLWQVKVQQTGSSFEWVLLTHPILLASLTPATTSHT